MRTKLYVTARILPLSSHSTRWGQSAAIVIAAFLLEKFDFRSLVDGTAAIFVVGPFLRAAGVYAVARYRSCA
jgi:hypothetical protein